MDKSKLIYSIIIAAAVAIAAGLVGSAYKNRNNEGTISVKRLGETNFESDLIVWEGNFSETNYNLQTAYANLEKTKRVIKKYLAEKGVKAEELVFSAVTTSNENKSEYSSDGRYVGQTFVGYRLTQTLKVESEDVEGIEDIEEDGIVYSPKLINGEIFFKKNTKLTRLAKIKER